MKLELTPEEQNLACYAIRELMFLRKEQALNASVTNRLEQVQAAEYDARRLLALEEKVRRAQ